MFFFLSVEVCSVCVILDCVIVDCGVCVCVVVCVCVLNSLISDLITFGERVYVCFSLSVFLCVF